MTTERRAAIESSEEFVAIATNSFFDNPNWHEDVALARELGKPITFLLREGTVVPPGALAGVERVISWRDAADIPVIAALLRARISGGGAVEVIDGELPS